MNERQIYEETWYLILSGSPDLPNVLNPFQFFFLERYLKNTTGKMWMRIYVTISLMIN